MNKDAIYKMAIEKWGRELQICMGIEEMAELTQALVKNLRGKKNSDNVIEEMVDVDIMLGQLKRLYDYGGEFNKIRRLKMKRLEKMILASKEA